jgi:hypothetical protein
MSLTVWISANTDILLGTINTCNSYNNSAFNNLQGGTAKAIVGFSSPIKNHQSAISRVFLNGLVLANEKKV